jgi:UMP-CMP kinase
MSAYASSVYAGDLLREELEKRTELSELINSYLKDGQIVPADITVRLLKSAMEKAYLEHNTDKFLIDGFPRDMHNFECWNKEMSRDVELQFILFLDCPSDVMIGR